MTSSLRARFGAVLRLDDPPRHLALALAVGAFIGCTPFWGLQTVLTILVATVFRLNRAAAVAGTWLNLPWLAPLVYGAAIKVGRLAVPGLGGQDPVALGLLLDDPRALSWETVWAWLRGSSVPLLVGCAIVGVLAAALTYVLALAALTRRRAGRGPSSRARQRVA